ncbi:magnesium transporter [Marmoricola endophyticus]|uniref:Magnesium transporter n=1 Tax=Marmoricola endophyticus TaxID=2040280 RepID=A0A917BQH9_9ACTN|nr:CBS domain-containing protein [Marmoricola endophyticus]GGF53196.1 magnesium transporter [Marmoricola endophyticus]
MSATPSRVFVARLAGLPVFDPSGDQVGKVRDVVVVLRSEYSPARVVGLVVEVFGRRRVFAPMTRITSMDPGHVITTGLLNMRRFEKRSTETLVIGEMLDRTVSTRGEDSVTGNVYDVAMEQARSREWVLSRVALQEPGRGLRRKGQTHVVEWRDVEGLVAPVTNTQDATHLVASIADLRPADAANVIHDLPPQRRGAVIAALDDDRLADILEEMPEEDQVEILERLESERAADVLEEMSADDAADLMAELPDDTQQMLLALMEPEDAEDVRRMMSYDDDTAGAMMTPEPVILSPDATVAEALAHLRQAELTPSLAAMVYVCRPPLETPTGKLMGVAHIQRLLREPPSSLVAGTVDSGVSRLRPEASTEDVAGLLATYNMVAAPVVDEEGRLLGAVTVDDLLDHMLPEGWRDDRLAEDRPWAAATKSAAPKKATPAKKSAATKKTATKKAAAKKTATKKSATKTTAAKKTTTKKTATKSPAKRTAAKKSTTTKAASAAAAQREVSSPSGPTDESTS